VHSCRSWTNPKLEFVLSFGKLYPSFLSKSSNHFTQLRIWYAYYQNDRNDEINRDYDAGAEIGVSRISRLSNVAISSVRKCAQAVTIWYCHFYFPRCDRTQSVYKEQKMCHKSCLDLTHMCGKLLEMFIKYYTIEYTGTKKLYRCELQPTRNAGDSPEWWYFNGVANSTGNIIVNSC
jgi:hypothetical protein